VDSREAERIRESMCLALWLAAGGEHDAINADTFTDPDLRRIVAERDLVRLARWFDGLDVRWEKGGKAVDALVDRTNDQAEWRRRMKAARRIGIPTMLGTVDQQLHTLRELGIGDG